MDLIAFDRMDSESSGRATLAAASSQGNSRKENMDYAQWFFHRESSALCLVLADGMGGPAGGKEASRILVNEVGRVFVDWRESDWGDCLTEGILAAARLISERAGTDDRLADMGSTVVAVVVDGGQAIVAHVGDSRAVLFRDDCIGRLTSDHLSIVEYGIKDASGQIVYIEENQAKGHPESNVLSRSVGGGDDLVPEDIDLGTVDLRPGDTLLLCSDGITEYVPEANIVDMIQRGASSVEIAQGVVEWAVRAGSHDHCTALVLIWDAPEGLRGV